MVKLAAISPRTNAMMSVNPGDVSPEQQQFEQLFSEMAHANLGAKSPELANTIVHFKVLESNLEENTATGVFVCDIKGKDIHIPIILGMGSIKTPEVFYSPMDDQYFPLDTKWLAKLDSPKPGGLGESIPIKDSPEFADTSLGNITTPPAARNKFSSVELPLLLNKLPNRTKIAFANYLKSNHEVLKKGVKYHGRDFVDSLTLSRVKEASARVSPWYVVGPSSSPEEFKRAFGDQYKLAFVQARNYGFAYADFRKNAADLVETTSSLPKTVVEPRESGIYKIVRTDGTHVKALVMRDPQSMGHSQDYTYLCILENGDYLVTDKIAAVPTEETLDSDSPLYKRLDKGPVYRAGTLTFVKYLDNTLYGSTVPEEIVGFTDRTDKVTTAQIRDSDVSLVFVESAAHRRITRPEGSNQIFIPAAYKPLSLRNRLRPESFVRDTSRLHDIITSGVNKVASSSIRIKNMGEGDWGLDGTPYGQTPDLLRKLASMGVGLESAVESIKNIPIRHSKAFHLVKRSNLLKLGSIFGPAPEVPPEVQAYEEGYNAAMQAPMPPNMQQPMVDPQTGESIDPQTGFPIDPNSGMPINPETGALIDPSSGQEVDPETGEVLPSPEEQQIMEAAAQANDQKVLDSAIAAILLEEANLPELVSQYLPKLREALDSLARIILTVQLSENKLSEKIGEGEYTKLEGSLKKVLKGLGDIILRLNDNSTVSGEVNYGEFSQ